MQGMSKINQNYVFRNKCPFLLEKLLLINKEICYIIVIVTICIKV